MEHNISTINEQVIAIRQLVTPNERHREYWSESERDQLREMFANGIGITEMALTFRRSEMAVVNQLNTLGLFKKCRAPKRQKKECLCPQCSRYGQCKTPCKAVISDS